MKKNNDYYFIKIFLFFIIMIVAGMLFRHFYYSPVVNSQKLSIVTPLNDNQAYHPKVVSFEKPWNGYKYWMAYTPYPNGNEVEENPVINASNDMINWEVPDGLVIPLDKPDNANKYHYNSDTHLLFNQDTENLELFWRYVDDDNNDVFIYKVTSSDGINWSKKEEFLISNNRTFLDFVSPAIIYDSDLNLYRVWYVNNKAVYYLETAGADAYNSSNVVNATKIDMDYPSNYQTWHLDVIYNEESKQYEMVTCAYIDVNNRKNMPLFYSFSNDNINWAKPIKILMPSTEKGLWDNAGLYRSSLLYEDGYYYLFYSGHNADMNVGIGLMYGKNIKELKPYTGGKN